ncbi:MAG: DUF1015 domain-containing protein [Syntrophobacterales bacterium]|nr:DUF1015 domain-containing protein [Syntrophobacterales bacterium]
MVAVTPFRAVRPAKKYVKDVASYPYDVIDSREARILTRKNAKSFLRIVKSEVDFQDNDTAGYEKVYEKARENLYDFLQRDILFQDKKECFYVYMQKMDDHVQYGIVACVSVADYESGHIKRHELTRKDKELDRTKHIGSVNAQTGPVFLTYKASNAIDMTVKDIVKGNPEYDFTADDGIAHSVWVVDDEKLIERIRQEFGKLDSLYIADGHHRVASAAAVARMRREKNKDHNGREEYNRIMVVICPHDQLNVMDYNRVIRDLGGLNEDQFIKKVQERFILSDDFRERSPQRQGEFGMYMNGVWRKLQAVKEDKDENNPVRILDVSILQDSLLRPVLGIDEPRTDDRILFVGGIRGMDELERLVDSGEYAVAFSLYPTTMDQLIEIADMGKIMPPKSTWFEPKLRSGIFVHLLD